MAYTYRANTTQGNASGGAVTVSRPTGTADGDLILVLCYLESDANSWNVVGNGFALLASQTNPGAFRLDVYFKWASNEPASWTWTPTTNNWRSIVAVAYSGGPGAGWPLDVVGGSQADAVTATSQTAPSVTPTASDDLLVFVYANYSGTDVTALTGAVTTLRQSYSSLTLGDTTLASSSATGTTRPSGGVGTETYAALHLALRQAPPSTGPTALRPTGDGNYDGTWSLTGGTAGQAYTTIDEATADDTDYISNNDTSSPYDRQSVTLADLPAASSIQAVLIRFRARCASSTLSMIPFYRLGGVDTDRAAAFAVTTTDTEYTWEITADRGWTESDLNSLEIGWRKNATASNTLRITQAWVDVIYTAPAPAAVGVVPPHWTRRLARFRQRGMGARQRRVA